MKKNFFKVKNLTPNQAAAQAFQLFSQEAKLCEAHPSKVPRTQGRPTNNTNCNTVETRTKSVEPSNEPVPSNSSIPGDIGNRQQDVGNKGKFKI